MFSRTFLAAESRHLLFYQKKGWFFPQRKSRKTKLDITKNLTQKFFAVLFYKKKGWFFPQSKSRKTNLLKIFLTQKFFAYFFTKK